MKPQMQLFKNFQGQQVPIPYQNASNSYQNTSNKTQVIYQPVNANKNYLYNQSNNRTVNQDRKSGLKNTQMNSWQKAQNDIEMNIMIQAMSHSFTKRISNGKDINKIDVIKDFSMQQERCSYEENVLQAKWYTVQVDQGKIPEKSFIQEIFCTSQKNLADRPISLKYYHLILPFGGKQINLTSMQNPKRYYIINLDLVEVRVIDCQNHFSKDEIIRLQVNRNWIIDMYISHRTQPLMLQKISILKIQQNAKKKRDQLEKYLRKSIQHSRAVQFTFKRPITQIYSDYQKRRFVTEQQFTRYCETGDLLLFRDNHTMAKIQRVITSSDYDHVALVFRSQRYGICLFQSNSNTGVAMTVWNHLIRHRWFENIQKIAWKKLQYDRPFDFEAQVDDFIQANLRKQFQITIPKLLRFKSFIQKNAQQEKNRTYFCSELVATLYKRLGLLQPKKSSTQYWPRDFSDNGYVSMLKNSSLGRQRQIIFSQQILKKNYPFLK